MRTVFPSENGNSSIPNNKDRGDSLPLVPSCVTGHAKINECISIQHAREYHWISCVVRDDEALDVSVTSFSSLRTRPSRLIRKRAYGAHVAGRELGASPTVILDALSAPNLSRFTYLMARCIGR